ncbi:hypothetical protein JZ751_018005, partial [Albula glossodonta]
MPFQESISCWLKGISKALRTVDLLDQDSIPVQTTFRAGRHGIAISVIVWSVSLSAALPPMTDCYFG